MANKKTAPVKGGHRIAILRAATQEFAARGFSGATTVEIARLAGVTQPLVHHHFGSKEKLWSAVLTELFGGLEQAIARASQPVADEDGRDRLQRLLRTVILFSAERPELSRLIRLESTSGHASFEELYTHHLEPLLAFFDTTLRQAEAAGVVRPLDRGFVYFALIGAGTQLFAEPTTARRAFGLDPFDPRVANAYADFIIDVMLAGIWAPRDRRARAT